MNDYLYIVAHTPLLLYEAAVSVWSFIYNQPWPSYDRIFQGIVVGFISWIALYLPKSQAERRLRRLQRRQHRKITSGNIPEKHQVASAASGAISSLLHKS